MTLQEELARVMNIPKKEEISGIIEERNNFVFAKKRCLYKKPKLTLNGFFDPKEKNGAVKIIKKAEEKNMNLKTTCQYKILEMISQLKSMATKEVLEMLPEFKSSTVMTTLSKFPSTMLSRTKSGSKNGKKTIYTYVGSGDIMKESDEYSKLISLKRTSKKKSLPPKIIKNQHIESAKVETKPKKVPVIDNIDLISKMMQDISELKNYIMSFESSVKQHEIKMVKILQNLIIKNKNISNDELEILKM